MDTAKRTIIIAETLGQGAIYAARYGYSRKDVFSTEESLRGLAPTRVIIIGQREDKYMADTIEIFRHHGAEILVGTLG